MKIIFLDIDGVICTLRSHFAQRQPRSPFGMMLGLDREAVGLLNFVGLGRVDDPVRFVLCSSWRRHYPRAFIESELRNAGFTGEFHQDWATAIALMAETSDLAKGVEVADWLERHADEVKGYIIIDDRGSFSPVQEPFRIRPNYADGFSWANFRQAMKTLHGFEGLPAE